MTSTLSALKAEPRFGIFRFRARNTWVDGAHEHATTQSFYGHTDTPRPTGSNPAAFVLHALAACLTTSLVHVAAARNVRLTEVESTLEGDMDVRGALGLSEDVRNGFTSVRVSFRIYGDASPDTLCEIVDPAHARCAVFDMVGNGVHVEIRVVTD
jgi:uncharacterized OsmC-like protein